MCGWIMNHCLGGKADGKTEEKRKVVKRLNDAGVFIELIDTAVVLNKKALSMMS